MNLALEGFQNTTHFSMDSKGTYKPGGSRSAKTEEVAVKLTLAKVEKRRYGYLLDTTKTTMINVEFSQNPDYNTLLIWKSQVCHNFVFYPYTILDEIFLQLLIKAEFKALPRSMTFITIV